MLTRVASYITSIEAHLARGRLEAEGIPAFVFHEHHVGMQWQIAIAMTMIKVYVHRNDAARAAEIVAAHDRGDFALPDEDRVTCPRCHNEQVVQRRLSWKSALLAVHLTAIPLFFRWATNRCMACRHEWDLHDTRTFPVTTVAVVAAVVAIITAFLFTTYCVGGEKYWLIFSLGGVCRG